MKNNQKKAIALISGGLDSLLAAKVIQDLGVHVEGINFFTGFCVEGHTHAIRNKKRNKPLRNNALWVADQLKIPLHIIDIVDQYKEVLLNPKHGYGANMNPCLDCKIFMVKKAHEWLVEHNFDFIITGEVIGQRPMSQRKDTMRVVFRDSGAENLLVRPLCAKNLPETKPELEGWIERDKLYNFSGRTRKPQMALAKSYGFEDYATPAGGCCFLTDKQYSNKLVDMWQARNAQDYSMDDLMLLKVGRHIRPKPNFKLIIARDEGENNFMSGYRKQFINLQMTNITGPFVLVDGEVDAQDLIIAARITARFSKDREKKQTQVSITLLDGSSQIVNIKPMSATDLAQEWYV